MKVWHPKRSRKSCRHAAKQRKSPARRQVSLPSCFLRRSSTHSIILEKKSESKATEKKLNGTVDEHAENSNASMMSVNGHDQSSLVKDEITPKRNAQRSVKGKVTKYGSDNDDDDEGIIQGMESDEVESDYMGSDSDTEKKIKKTLAKPKKVTKPKSGQIPPLSQTYPSFSLALGTSSNSPSPIKKKVSNHHPLFREQKIIETNCLDACGEKTDSQSRNFTESWKAEEASSMSFPARLIDSHFFHSSL